jgi:hypothetical protein
VTVWGIGSMAQLVHAAFLNHLGRRSDCQHLPLGRHMGGNHPRHLLLLTLADWRARPVRSFCAACTWLTCFLRLFGLLRL